MAQGTSISQRLAFEGLEDITKRLQAMGEAGAKSIEQIRTATGETNQSLARLSAAVNDLKGIATHLKGVEDAGAHAAGGVTNLGHAVGGLNFEHTTQHLSLLLRGLDILDSRSIEIGQSLAHLGGVFTGVVGAIGTAVIGFGALSVSAAQSTREIGNQAATLGLTRDAFEGLKFAGESVGVSTENLTRGLDRFSAKLGQARESEQKLSDELVITGEKNRIAVAKLALAVDEQNLSLDRNAVKQRGLADAISAARLAAEKAQEAFDHHSHSVEQAQITAEKAQLAYQKLKDEFNTTGLNARQAREAQLNLTEAQLHAKEAQEGVREAEKKRQDELKELGKALERIKQAQAAFDLAQKEAAIEAKKAALALDEEKLKINELAHAADTAKNVFQKLNVNINADDIAVLEQTVERLNAIPDAARRNALSLELLGRSFRTLTPFIRQSKEELQERIRVGEHFAFTSTDDEVKASVKLNSAYYKVTTALEGMKNAFGNIISGNFVGFLDSISNGIANNTDNIRRYFTQFSNFIGEWGSAFGNVLGPVLQSAFAIIRVTATAVLGILDGIKVRFDALAEVINKFTGTNLTGADILVGLGLVYLSATRLLPILISLGSRFVQLTALVISFGRAAAAAIVALDFASLLTPLGVFRLILLAISAAILLWPDSFGPVFKGFKKGLDDLIETVKALIHLLEVAAAVGFGLKPPEAPGPAAPSGASSDEFNRRVEEENPKLFPPGGVQHHQAGGWVGGSGSGDHVPILAEPGEHITNKRSASMFGPLLEAINSARGFSMGGIVDSLNSIGQTPVVLSTGGAAAKPTGDDRALFHLTIGDSTFKGLSAPRDTADEMLQFSRRSSVLSMGKKQSWYGS